jgi:zinc protease
MRMKKIILSINTVLVCFLLATSSWATVHEKILENGLKVIVKEDHRAPVATAQVWYKVGSASEYGGITGVSHVLEHMMFKGTPKHPVGKFSEILASIGARDNAFTSRDYTAYYQLFDVSKLETSFELESDRMAQLNLDESEFIKELEVVKEERRLRTEDNPNALTYEQFSATAFNSSPYRNPVIGWMNDLDSMQVTDLRAWYEQWYTPNNATLVVVGDVNPEQVFALAEKYYGVVPAREISKRKSRLEPVQVGERRVEIKALAKLPYMIIGYKAPSLKTVEDSREAYALNILSGILDGGRSSRLSKNLVREQEVAASVGAGYDLYSARSNMFLFDGTPNAENTLEELEQAIYQEINKLQNELVSERELKRVKAQVVAGEVYQQDSVQRQAYVIGSLEAVGHGWGKMNEYADNIQKITAEDVRDVTKKYLIDDFKTVAILTPIERESLGAK